MVILEQKTGLPSYECTPITKSPGTIFFETSKTIGELVNEKITIKIQRKNVSDVYIVRDMNLRKFLLACLKLNNQVILGASGTYKTVVPVDLGLEAGILLGADDRIIISLSNCLSTAAYQIYYTEDREATKTHVSFEEMSVLAGERDKTFQVGNHNVVAFDNPEQLTEIVCNIGGKDFHFTPDELQFTIRQDDPILGYSHTGGIITHLDDVLVLDLLGMDSITLHTTGEAPLSLMFGSYTDLASAAKTPVRSLATAIKSVR